MWFKQIQLFPLSEMVTTTPNKLAEQLEPLAFRSCLPSMPSSMGWVAPVDEEDAPLARGINGCIMICLQLEEKILPASVVNDSLKDKIKRIELHEARRVRAKEKLSYKDEVVQTLLPRAFSKFTQIYAYIDTRNGWLILNNTSPAKTELFISLFKKSLGEIIGSFDIAKPSAIVTHWLKTQDFPAIFSIEKSCVLQDPNEQHRMIRCQHQDLFANSIQALVKDGCEAIQIALRWHDRLDFVLSDDFSIRSIKLAEDDLAEINDGIETKLQKFDADLVMMSEMFAGLCTDLLAIFEKKNQAEPRLAATG